MNAKEFFGTPDAVLRACEEINSAIPSTAISGYRPIAVPSPDNWSLKIYLERIPQLNTAYDAVEAALSKHALLN